MSSHKLVVNDEFIAFRQSTKSTRSRLVIWLDGNTIGQGQIDIALQALGETSYDSIALVGPAESIRVAATALDRYQRNAGENAVEVLRFTVPDTDLYAQVVDAEVRGILSAGVDALVRESHAVLDARSHAYHYLTPSGAHQGYFVRLGDALRNKAAVRLVAMACAEAARDLAGTDAAPPKHVFVDSTTILAVGIEVARLLSGPSRVLGASVVDLGDRDSAAKLDQALFVESVASSGTLEASLRESLGAYSTGLRVVRVVDLAYAPDDLGRSVVAVTDLGEFGQLLQQHRWTAGNCALCESGSPVIRVSATSFTFDRPNASYRNMAARYVAGDFMRFMPGAIEASTLSVSGDPRRTARRRVGARATVHLDLTEAVARAQGEGSSTDLVEQVRATAQDLAAAGPATVIVGADDSVFGIIEIAKSRFGLRDDCEVLDADELEMLDEANGPVVVLVPVIESGREAERISTMLRERARGAKITYLAVVARPLDHDRYSELVSNLRFDGNALTHDFEAKYVLPHVPFWEFNHNPWRPEQEVWLSAELGEFPGVSARQEKVTALLREESLVGHRDSLFLPDAASTTVAPGLGPELALQDGFSFWPAGTDCSIATHADVMFTISFALERMRRGGGGQATAKRHKCGTCGKGHVDAEGLYAVLHQDYNGSRIDPGVFKRLSDGVVQAAVLRAGRSVEFDYSGSRLKSFELVDIVLDSVASQDALSGNALPEFLFAVHPSVRRMRLFEEARVSLIGSLSEKFPGTDSLAGAMVAWHRGP